MENTAPSPAIQLLHGDCIQQMRQIPDKSIHSVITDPPYSSGTRREAGKGVRKSMTRGTEDEEWFTTDCLTTNGFIYLMRECALEWKRVLVPGGHVLVFIDWRMMPALAGAIESADFRHIGLLVWNKTYFGMGAYFRNQHELILHFTNGRSLPPQRHDVGNVISVPPIKNGDHPTEKPVELMKGLISVTTSPFGTVLDPFMGSGSTMVAAQQLGRSAIGIEVGTQHYETAKRRIEGGQTSLLSA